MSDGSPIEWLQRPGTKPATWNPIRALNKFTGKRGWFCTHVHEGCRNCYAERLNVKDGDTGGNGIPYRAQDRELVDIILHDATLLQPLKWKSPRTIFVCSMTDVFGEWVADEWLDSIFMIATRCPQHTFIMLTKRPARMRDYLIGLLNNPMAYALSLPWKDAAGKQIFIDAPLPNVWGLVSCSTQEDFNNFYPHLRATPLAVRGLSLEPLLGPIDASEALGWRSDADGGREPPKIDWVIVGGESGKNARPMHPDWPRSLRDQCAAAHVAFFMKQWGEWGCDGGPPLNARDRIFEGSARCAWWDRAATSWRYEQNGFVVDMMESKGSGDWLYRLGKKAAGRLLDGREHNEFPVTDSSVAQRGAASHENNNREASRA